MSSLARPRTGVARGGARRHSQGVALCAGMLKGAMVGANIAMAAALGCGLALGGARGAVNAAVAGGLALVFFATGQGVQLIATQLADGTGLAVLLTSFLLRAGAMAGLLWYAMGHAASLEPVFHRGAFMTGALLVTAGWVAGVLVTGSRQKVYAYDSDYETARGNGGSL